MGAPSQDPSLGGVSLPPLVPTTLISNDPILLASNNFLAFDTLSTSELLGSTPLDVPSPGAPSLSEPTGSGLSISDYFNSIHIAMNNNDVASATSATQTWIHNASLWWEVLTSATAQIAFKSELNSESTDEDSFYSTEQSELYGFNNGPLANYNNIAAAAATASSNIFTLQQQYSQGTITTAQYNAQVTIWNNNLSSLNSQLQTAYTTLQSAITTLNGEIAQNNTAINALNTSRAGLGLTTTIPNELPVDPTKYPAPPTLPSVTPGPPAPPSPTVPNSIATGPNLSTDVGISTTIDMAGLSIPENALLNVGSSSLAGRYDKINSESLNTYNNDMSASQSLTEALFEATANYQATPNATTLAAYNSAVTAYLNYANTANTTLTTDANNYITAVQNFNSNLTGINNQIATFNNARLAAGEPLIPTQNPIPVPTLNSLLLPTNVFLGPPPPTTNVVPQNMPLLLPVAPIGSSLSTAGLSPVNTQFADAFVNASASLALYSKKLLLKQAHDFYRLFTAKGASPNSPHNAYIDKAPDITVSSSALAAGTGAALTGSILGLSDKTLNSVISSNILYLAQSKAFPNPTRLANFLALGAFSVAQNASLAAALPALASLGSKAELAASPGIVSAAALASNYATTINDLISQGVTGQLTDWAMNKAGVSPDAIAQLSGPITAGVNLGLLQTALLGIAKAFGLNGLVAQVLANSTSGPVNTTPYGLNDVLNNPVSGIILKQKLADQLAGTGTLTQSTAESLINSTVNKVLGRAPFVNNIEFANNLLSSLQEAGIENANQLADTATSFVRSEQLVQDQDTAFNQQALQNQIASNDQINQTDVQNAINDTLNQQDYETKREFGDQLAQQLEIQGNTQQEARDKADQVLLSIQSDALKNSFKSQNIAQDELTQSIKNQLIAHGEDPSKANGVVANLGNFASELLYREGLNTALNLASVESNIASTIAEQTRIGLNLVSPLEDNRSRQILHDQDLSQQLAVTIKNQLKKKIGLDDATKFADQLVLTVIGPANSKIVSDELKQPTSILNQINQSINTIREAFGQKADLALTQNFQDFQKPNVDLFAYLARVYDPGNTVLMSAGTAITHSKHKGDAEGAIQV
jgi:hypothetical protein